MRLNSRSFTSSLEEAGPCAGDAVRYRISSRPRGGPPPETTWFPPGGVRGEIRVGGAWRAAQILTRHRWPEGIETVDANVFLPEPA
ncbi:hypothetical protein [Streptomyces sp. 8L]|uniref:hypothetical protein n=1 Tax=Streptomyces sp. 8L TaxID=2877242 RepID=UPI001CD4CD0E|nr:hypothetical protein [Streptomyces sp. 8L]MCA1217216.1 hypothetical protein [Streptomyces sp. 8L]